MNDGQTHTAPTCLGPEEQLPRDIFQQAMPANVPVKLGRSRRCYVSALRAPPVRTRRCCCGAGRWSCCRILTGRSAAIITALIVLLSSLLTTVCYCYDSVGSVACPVGMFSLRALLVQDLGSRTDFSAKSLDPGTPSLPLIWIFWVAWTPWNCST